MLGIGALLLVVMVGFYLRAASRINHVALDQSPGPVGVVYAKSSSFQPIHEYVGVLEAWNEARVGPQYVSAHVESVRFRPGASVHQGEVLATLDCRFTFATRSETAAQTRAVAHRQVALAHEAERMQTMERGGFASINEVELLHAGAASEREQIRSLRATQRTRQIEVADCVLHAPFSGDVISRFVDPGAYVRPGDPLLTVADRATVRVAADAPEIEFSFVAVGTLATIDVESVSAHLAGPIARRTPAAEHGTRTVHFEIDLPNGDGALPIGSTARVQVPSGKPESATLLPSQAAKVRGDKASLFVVEKGIARLRTFQVLGQRQGLLYLVPSLKEGAAVILEGRSLLRDGDRVSATPTRPAQKETQN